MAEVQRFVGTMLFYESKDGPRVNARTAVAPLPWEIGKSAHGCRSLESIASASSLQFFALHGVGPKAMCDMREALESRGVPKLTD